VVGALTSATSLLEVVVASAMDGLGWSRARATLLAGAAAALVGVPSAWSTDFLGVMDKIANNVLLLGGGLALAIFTGWVMKSPEAEAARGADGVRWFFLWRQLLRFVVPLVLVYVLWDAVPATWSAVAGLVSGD
jgi:neurotransmitter:Na+ symporter, NSS family